jgi:hypothetical protein
LGILVPDSSKFVPNFQILVSSVILFQRKKAFILMLCKSSTI